MIELIPQEAACFACRNMQVSASSWLQGDAKLESIALLLTTFSYFVTTILVSIVINSCRFNVLSVKTEIVQFCSQYTEDKCSKSLVV